MICNLRSQLTTPKYEWVQRDRGGHGKKQQTIKRTSNQPMPPDRSKAVHHSRQSSLGSLGNNDKEVRASQNTVNASRSTNPDTNASAQQLQRPVPLPEHPLRPPPALPRSPKPGTKTIEMTRQQRATQKSSAWNKAGHCRAD